MEGIWIKGLLGELGLRLGTVRWNQDNQATIAIINSEKNIDKGKHVMIKIFYLRELVEKGDIKLIYTESARMVADIFTKPLATPTFLRLRDELGLTELGR